MTDTEAHAQASPVARLPRPWRLIYASVGIVAGLAGLTAAFAQLIRHQSTSDAAAFAIGGLGILASVALDLATPPKDPASRLVFRGTAVLIFAASAVLIFWFVSI